ncbi:MAG TPA: hypothetical protein PLD88_11205 [Candidatus Berkiella sp.]|nr:hypothetical protein [Candidatus Berkiella sp.]
MHNGFKINYAHGHDSSAPHLAHCFNIDNNFGKFRNIADYKALYTFNNKPALELNIKAGGAAANINMGAPNTHIFEPQYALPKLAENTHNKDLDILMKFISRAKAKYTHLRRGRCIQVKKEKIGSQYHFQVGVGATSGLFYISNRNIHVMLEENGTLSFYKKNSGVVDYKNKVNYQEVADENLLTSIINKLKLIQAAKTQTNPILNQFTHQTPAKPDIESSIEATNQVKAFIQKNS